MAKLGIGYLTSHRYAAHPFSAASANLAYDPAQARAGDDARLPADFMLDAVLLLGPEHSGAELRRIDWDPETGTFALTLIALPDQSVSWIDVPDVPAVRAAMVRGGYYMLGAERAGIPQYALRAVCDSGFVRYLEQVKASGYAYFSPGVRFADEALDRSPPKVLSLALYRGNLQPVEPGRRLEGHVSIAPGYNVSVDVAAPSPETDATELVLHAVAGAGLGKAPCTAVPGTGHPTMALTPDAAGDVRIEGDACYAVVPNRQTRQILVQGTCYSCCTCDDYVRVGRRLADMLARTHAGRLELEALHAEYGVLVDDYTQRHFPALRKGYLRVHAHRGFKADNPRLGGAIRHGHATVIFTNKSEGPLAVTIVSSGGGQLVGGVCKVGSASATGCGLSVGATVPKGATLTAAYRFKAPGGSLGTFSASATYTVNGRSYSESASTAFGAPN